MEQQQTIKQYISSKAWTKTLAIILIVLTVVGIATSFVVDRLAYRKNAVFFDPTKAETGTNGYIDIVGISDWIYQYGDDVYYCAEDADGYLYTLRMTKSQANRMKAQREYWDRETDSAPQPDPVRVYGEVIHTPSMVRSNMAKWWEITTSSYDDNFGKTILNTVSEKGSVFAVLAIVCGCIGAAILISYCSVSGKTKRSLNRLETLGLLSRAEQELNAENQLRLSGDSGRLSEQFLFGKGTGIAVPLTDILWCYQRDTRQYGSVVNSALVLYTREKKQQMISLGKKDSANEVASAMAWIYQRNPNVLLGFTGENQRAYKERLKTLQE